MRRDSAYHENDLGLQQGNLTFEVSLARRRLFRQRVTIVGGAAFNDIGDVHFLTLQPYGEQHGVEQLTSAPHEGLALTVFISAGGLTDDHPSGLMTADTEYGLGTPFMQCAGRACRYLCLQLIP